MTRLEAPACNCGRAADLRVGGGFLGTFDTCQQCLDRLRRDMFPHGRPPSFTTVATYHTQEDTMPTTDTAALSDQLTPLAAEYAQLAEQAEQVKARQEAIKAQIRELVPGPGKWEAGALSVAVSQSHRFNETKALALIPEQLNDLLTYPETRVDKEKFKALLPDAFAQAQDLQTERVTIR